MGVAQMQAAPADGASKIDESVVDVAIRVFQQGAVVVNSARLYRRRPGIACIYIDLRSKYARLSGLGGGDDAPPNVSLAADPRTMYLDRSRPKDEETFIEFPEYTGWSVFSADGSGRYTVRVCLVAPEDKPYA